MKSKKMLVGLIVVGLIVACAGVAIAKKPKVEDTIAGAKNGPRVQVEKVKKDNIETKISSSGKLEADNKVTIYAEASSKLVKVNKKVGDTVKKGEVILTLDNEGQLSSQKQIESLNLQLKATEDALSQLVSGGTKQEILNAQSAILKADVEKQNTEDKLDTKNTDLENLQRDLKTQELECNVQKESFSQGLISQKELDDAETKLTKLKQEVESTETAIAGAKKELETIALDKEIATHNLDLLLNKIEDPTKRQNITAKQAQIKEYQTQIFNEQTKLEKIATEVVAPIDGVITEAPDTEGLPITQGAVLATIIDPSKLVVECKVSPYYAPDLKEGLNAIIKYSGSKTVEVQGKITKVFPMAISEAVSDKGTSNTFIPVKVEVLDAGDVIKAGLTVDVKLITETRENVCLVPLLATMEDDDDNTYLYVVAEDGTLEKRNVEQGLSNGLYIEVNNVEEGEIIVSNPSDYLSEGTQVSYEKIGDEQ